MLLADLARSVSQAPPVGDPFRDRRAGHDLLSIGRSLDRASQSLEFRRGFVHEIAYKTGSKAAMSEYMPLTSMLSVKMCGSYSEQFWRCAPT